MKKTIISLSLVLAMMATAALTGCSAEPTVQESPENAPAQEAPAAEPAEEPTTEPEATEEAEPVQETESVTIEPLPNTTLAELDNSIVHIGLKEGDVYLNDEGALMMKMQVYTYDCYDMVEIAAMKAGDVIMMAGVAIPVETVEQIETGDILINGGLEQGGYNLQTQDDGVYSVVVENDAKEWYLAGEAEYRVSDEFEFRDSSDPDSEEKVYYPGDMINGEVTIDDYFIPYNTTARIEDGKVVELNRVYIP